MGRRPIRGFAVAVVAVLVLAVAGTALAGIVKVRIQAGNLLVIGEGGFAPSALPKSADAPITIFGKGRLATIDGELPPILKTIEFEFDKHGSIQTEGLPVCTAGKLQATTVPQARKLCPGAIVGRGFGHAVVKFPEQAPIPDLLADHDLQRPAHQGGPERLRALLHDGSGGGRLRRPDPDRNDPQRSLRLPRQRRRSRRSPTAPASPFPVRSRSAAGGPTRASSTATSTPAALTVASRRSADSASATAPG